MGTVKKKVAGIEFVAELPAVRIGGEDTYAFDVMHRFEIQIAHKLIELGAVKPDALRFVRLAAKLLIKDVAAKFGVDEKTIRRWESGESEIPLPTWATMAALFMEHADRLSDRMSVGRVLDIVAAPPKRPKEVHV